VTDEELLAAAETARRRAYAPYSGFTVGAALLCADGTLVTGGNVENASYGLTICAERAAVVAAVAAGKRDFAAIAVAGPPGVAAAPCGACRQVLSEFGSGLRVLYASPGGSVATTIAALLPAPFEASALRGAQS
jgi:cytidine deaminase